MGFTGITQSLVKAFLHKGKVIDYCARKIYHRYFLQEKVEETTDSQMKGIFFERLALGGDLITLPTKLNGDKKVDTLRIEQQVENFKRLQQNHLMLLYPLVNTQITLYKRYSFEYRLKGTLDWFPTFFLIEDQLRLCVIDLKLTMNLNNTFSEFSWGKPENLDLIQAGYYSNLVQEIDWEINPHIPSSTKALIRNVQRQLDSGDFTFYFLVFDYKEPPEYRFIEVPWDISGRQSLENSIEKTIVEMEYCHTTGWKPNPSSLNCKRCILPCNDRFEAEQQQPSKIIQLTH